VEELSWLVLQAMVGRYHVIDVLYLYYVKGFDTRRIGRRLGMGGYSIRSIVEGVWFEVRSVYTLQNYLSRYYPVLLEVEPLMVPSEDGFTCRLCGTSVLRLPARHVLDRHQDLVLLVRDMVVREGRARAGRAGASQA
jgi:hypothetical protein